MKTCFVCETKVPENRKYCSRKCVSQNQPNKIYRNQFKRGMLRKLELLKLKGNKCEKCDYAKSTRALSFHHRIPADKSFALDIRHCSNRSWNLLLKELEKCDLLCLNCHAEVEADIIGFPHLIEELETENTLVHEDKNKPPKIRKEKLITKKRESIPRSKKILYCKQCNSEFTARDGSGIYCSDSCYGMSTRRVERPNKENLEKLVNDYPLTEIGKMFGVTDNAIRKWIICYQLTIPEHRTRKKNRFMNRS